MAQLFQLYLLGHTTKFLSREEVKETREKRQETKEKKQKRDKREEKRQKTRERKERKRRRDPTIEEWETQINLNCHLQLRHPSELLHFPTPTLILRGHVHNMLYDIFIHFVTPDFIQHCLDQMGVKRLEISSVGYLHFKT